MVIKNGLVFTPDCRFAKADLAFENGHITQIAPPGSISGGEVYDAKGGYVIPGFVDIHTHGCMNSDICDADAAGIEKMLKYYGENGITTVVPATMSYNEPILADLIKVALDYFDKEEYGAVLRGINMEGPFINTEKRGAQNPQYIEDPNLAMFNNIFDLAKGYVKLVDMAPELPGSAEFISKISDKCTVSIAHTDANYDQAAEAFKAGARHVTHLFNAMPPFTHRQPGVIGAASDYASNVEVISDGIHLHPAVVRSAFKWFGEDRVCLISDSMRGTGMPDGEYDLGGQMVKLENDTATLVNGGALAGSVANLAEMCRRAISFGVPIEQAVRAATYNPACAVLLQNQVGSFAKGNKADILVWDEAYKTQKVFVGGKAI